MAASHVDDLSYRGIRHHGTRARSDHVVDAYEIAALRAVLEHQWRLLVEETRGKDRQHTRVRVRERLPGPVDIEETQSHGWDAVRATEDQTHTLLVVFRERVHRLERDA